MTDKMTKALEAARTLLDVHGTIAADEWDAMACGVYEQICSSLRGPSEDDLTCIFCGLSAGEDSMMDDNGAIACRKCGEAEYKTQKIEGLRL